MKNLWSILATFLFISSLAIAGEEALYAPVPPADSAFVRIVNITDDPDLIVKLDGVVLNGIKEIPVSDFVIIKQGQRNLNYADHSEELDIKAGKYYTIAILINNKVHLMDDALIENPSKAVLYFYNLSDLNSASLFAPSYKATIFENIATNTSISREINAVDFDLIVKSSSEEIKTLKDISLKRQIGTSIFLIGKKDAYQIFVVENKIKK